MDHKQWLDDIMAMTSAMIRFVELTMCAEVIPAIKQLQVLQLREMAPDCKCVVDDEMLRTHTVVSNFCKSHSIIWQS